MNKRIAALIALVLVFALGLSACGCAHETWNEANCVNPKTCADCGETEGEALGHTWKDADCTNPKTCKVCAATEGAPNGHSWLVADCDTPKTCEICGTTEGAALGHDWQDVSCAAPKTCSRCALTEGEALPHTWVDATTEAPKTCSVCGATEGERIITDPRFTTANTKDLYGEWVCEVELPGATAGLDDFTTPFKVQLHLSLYNDGKATVTMSLSNVDELTTELIDYMCNLTYATLSNDYEMSKEEADIQFKDTYGMTMEEYYSLFVQAMNLEHMFDALGIDGVYFAEDGVFHISEDWDDTMDSNDYTLEGDVFTLKDDPFGLGTGDAVFTRVTE